MHQNIETRWKKIYIAGFGMKTTGYGTGRQIENNTYQELTEGHLAGRGTVHFYNDTDLRDLLSEIGFININTDYDIYTDVDSTVHILSAIAEKEK